MENENLNGSTRSNNNNMEVKKSNDVGSGSTLLPIRPVKRSKQNNQAELPAVMWGAVMNYLEFSSVVSMTATSRAMRDAVPFVSELHIHESCQMHVSVGRRFQGVRDLFIYSLVRLWNTWCDRCRYNIVECESDFETSLRAAPFVSSFPSLKRVHFGARHDNGSFYRVIPRDEIGSTWFEGWQNFARLIVSFSGGFRSGLLRHSLELTGLSCCYADEDFSCCSECGHQI